MPIQAAARIDDQVSHTRAMPDMLIGVGLGVLVLVGGIAVTVATGGAALPVLIGVAAVGGGGLAGEMWGGAQDPSPCGPIVEGVPSIKIGPDAKEAAMATAHVHCNQHSAGTTDAILSDVLTAAISPLALAYSAFTRGSGPQIVEGSATVFLSSQRLMAARIGDKGTCGFVISEGCRTVIIGGPTGTAKGLSAGGEVPDVINYGLFAMTLAPAVAEVAAGGLVALGRVGLGFLGSYIGAEALGRVGEHYYGKKGKVIGQLVGGLVGGYGASKGAGKLPLERWAAPLEGAASRGWAGVKGFFGGSETGGGVGIEKGPGAGAGGASGGGSAPQPGEGPLPGGRTQADVDRANAEWEAKKQGWRSGDDLPGRSVADQAQAWVDAFLGRSRQAYARAGAGAGRSSGGRTVFDEGGGVFSKKGGNVMEMAAGDGAGGGGPKTPEEISKANYERAAQAKLDLPTNLDPKGIRTVSSAGGKDYLSGWEGNKPRNLPKSYDSVSPEDVKAHSDKIGHTLAKGSAPDQIKNGGFEGKGKASHAEKQALLGSGGESTGVSKDMCGDCQNFFKQDAIYNNRTNYNTDPNGQWKFEPDGTITRPDGEIISPSDKIEQTQYGTVTRPDGTVLPSIPLSGK